MLVDEVYLDAQRIRTRGPAATLGDRFISTSSLTKSYGLSSLRCGWAIASPDVAERIRRARDVIDGNGRVPGRTAGDARLRADRSSDRAGRLPARRQRPRGCAHSSTASPELEYVDPGGGTVVFPADPRASTTRRVFAGDCWRSA